MNDMRAMYTNCGYTLKSVDQDEVESAAIDLAAHRPLCNLRFNASAAASGSAASTSSQWTGSRSASHAQSRMWRAGSRNANCRRIDVDLCDARDCELHDPSSALNARQRSAT
jgi:hypothetical protein